MTVGDAVSKRLDYFLYQKKISLYKLAKDACIPVSTLQNLYRGHTKSPTLSLVLKITETLGVTLAEFIDDPLFSKDNLELD